MLHKEELKNNYFSSNFKGTAYMVDYVLVMRLYFREGTDPPNVSTCPSQHQPMSNPVETILLTVLLTASHGPSWTKFLGTNGAST